MSTLSVSVSRAVHLARWNAVLLRRNRLATAYAVVVPFTPLLLLLSGERGAPAVGAAAAVTTLVFAGLFPVYYNVLAQFVSRRDELVLKRMRTGESRDGELLAGIALPGGAAALVVMALAVPVSAALGQQLPVNPVLYALTALAVVVMFSAFAYWTAAWTRNAEAAQLTSMPVFVLALVGQVSIGFPDPWREIASWTPGAALTELVRVGWFGLPEGGLEPALTFAETWAAAAQPVLVVAAWTALATWLAARSLRWEPRS